LLNDKNKFKKVFYYQIFVYLWPIESNEAEIKSSKKMRELLKNIPLSEVAEATVWTLVIIGILSIITIISNL